MAAKRGDWTDAKLAALRPRATRYEMGIARGLRLWVYPTGRKSWVMSYKLGDERVRLTLGEYGPGSGALSLDKARQEFARRRLEADQAREGLGPAPKEAAAVARAERLAQPTVEDLASRWLKAPGKRGPKSLRTVTEQRRILDRDVLPEIGKLRASHVTAQHVRAVLDKIGARGAPVAESECGKLLRAMFRYAVERGELEHSPVERLKIRPAERRKDRVLTDGEIRTFLALLDADKSRVGTSTGLLLTWVLMTACRPGEGREARWSEIDERAGTWTVPAARTKNRRPHVVILSDAARGLLTEARKLDAEATERSPFIFPGLTQGEPLTEGVPSRAVLRLRGRLTKAGVAEPFTPHDLRRTAATIVAGRLGFGRFVASKLLGHVSETEGGVTAIYDRHDYRAETARAWQALGEYVAELRAGRAPKVRSLSEARQAKGVTA